MFKKKPKLILLSIPIKDGEQVTLMQALEELNDKHYEHRSHTPFLIGSVVYPTIEVCFDRGCYSPLEKIEQYHFDSVYLKDKDKIIL